MALKVTPEGTKMLLLRRLSLTTHWKLEQWAGKKKLGKEEAAEKILREGLKHVNLNLDAE